MINIKGTGFLCEDKIACIEKANDGHFHFSWKPWIGVNCDLPIIFWTSDLISLLEFIDFGKITISDKDKEMLLSSDCIPVSLERIEDEIWIG